MRHDQNLEKSGGDQPRRSSFGVRVRGWANSFADLAAYISRHCGQWLRSLSGRTASSMWIKTVLVGAVVVASIGGVFMYFQSQMASLGTQVQFSSRESVQETEKTTPEEPRPSDEVKEFHTGKVKLGLSEEELIEHLALEKEETMTTLARSGSHSPSVADDLSEEALGALNLSKLVWPVQGTVKTGYGWWRHPLYRDWRLHTGIAITVPVGSTVHAALPGRVVDIYHDNYLRTVVVLEHGGQVRTIYGNLQEVAVALGTSVSQGRALGRAAASVQDAGAGEAYFEVRYRGQAVDPLPYLR